MTVIHSDGGIQSEIQFLAVANALSDAPRDGKLVAFWMEVKDFWIRANNSKHSNKFTLRWYIGEDGSFLVGDAGLGQTQLADFNVRVIRNDDIINAYALVTPSIGFKQQCLLPGIKHMTSLIPNNVDQLMSEIETRLRERYESTWPND